MTDSPTRVRAIISGRVQGVWFRASVREVADALSLSGWVRNLADGSVEAVFEGPLSRVEKAIVWCASGPDLAVVDHVETFTETPEGLVGFQITG
ncbi:MAG: acylphosphatase [Coriobacteriia bacterium]|nr:acylphosphatase [Coriobacteriia bacterium]